jgi:hypothetical protein
MRTPKRAQAYCAIITLASTLATLFSSQLVRADGPAQDPNANCYSSSRDGELTPEASDNVDSASQVARKFHLTKMRMFEFHGNVSLQSQVKETQSTQANYDPTLPNAASDLDAAYNLFMALTDPGSSSGAKISGPVKAPVIKNGLPTSMAAYNAYMQANCAPMSANAKRAFIGSYVGNYLNDHYSGTKNGSLLQTLEALEGQNVPTGQCGPIAMFMSQTIADCGLPDSGVMSAILKSGPLPDEGHYVPFFKDPVTGHYVVYNYGAAFDTNETRLHDAVQVANDQLGVASRMSVVEENGHMVMDRLASGQHINDVIENAADMSPGHAHIEVNAGNLEDTATVRASGQTKGGINVGAYGTVDYVSGVEDHGLGLVAVGGVVQESGSADLTDKTKLVGSAQVTAGVLAIHDTPPGSVLNALTGPNNSVQGYDTEDATGALIHQKADGNNLTVAASIHADGGVDSVIMPPYESITITAEDTKNWGKIYIHSNNSLVSQSPETTSLTVANNYTEGGVTVDKKVGGVDIKNNAQVVVVGNGTGFGGNDQTIVQKSDGKLNFTATNSISYLHTDSTSVNAQPTIDVAGVQASLKTNNAGTFGLGVTVRNVSEQTTIHNDPYNLLPSSSDPNSQALHPPKLEISATWVGKSPSDAPKLSKKDQAQADAENAARAARTPSNSNSNNDSSSSNGSSSSSSSIPIGASLQYGNSNQ